jgi:23S rRNA G2445 N2-methylase RlmL
MAARKATRDVVALVREPGFTPSVRDLAGIAALLSSKDEALARDAEKALVRLGPTALPILREEATRAAGEARARLVRVVGALGAGDADAVAWLCAELAGGKGKSARYAAAALGKVAPVSHAVAEHALLEAWGREVPVELRRVLAESLGKIGSSAAAGALAGCEEDADDAELRRILGKAVLRLERDRVREEASAIDATASLDRPWPVVYRCRAGLESILVEELGAPASPRPVGEGRVQAVLRGALSAATVPRTATSFAFLLGPASGQDEAALAEGLLASDAAWSIFRTFTRGPIRFRLAFEGAGHRRGLVHRVAERVRAARPEVLNDPTGSTWEALVRDAREPTKTNLRTIVIELEPRALVDVRFDYRVADVPAASHPTIAAALARVAGVRPDDVVWDPFVGSALELIERARLGPYARMIGTDVDEGALESARANLARAAVDRVELVHADSTQKVPEGVTLLLTNPPMGRRVARGELAPLMDRFVHAAKEALGSSRSGGRLVWLSPMPERTRGRLEAEGFTIEVARPVDMGGFRAELQRATIAAWPGAASAGRSSSARRSSA